MREQLTQYVNLLFAGTPDSEDMKQEILQNTLDRYDDLIEQGKTPEAAYRLAITGIGDVNEVLGSGYAASPEEDNQASKSTLEPAKKKLLRSISIALYICCVIPVIIFETTNLQSLGVCLMFVIIAIATVLMILSSGTQKDASKPKNEDEPKTELGKALKSAWGIFTLLIYLGISFWSGAWYITWLVFPIMGALQGLIKAIFDLKEGNEHET